MKRAIPLMLSLCGVAAACEQAEQALPFEAVGAAVTRTVTPEGATVSTPQGASVQFPSGAFSAATEVTLTPVAPSAAPSAGTLAGAAAFRLAPEETALGEEAAVALQLGGGVPRDRAWLASVLHATPAGTREIGTAGVDLSAGVVRVGIRALGTLTAVIPEPAAVVRAEPLASEAPAGAGVPHPLPLTRSLRADCGAPGKRCAIRVQASQGLLDAADSLAVVFPRQSGEIRIQGTTASGSLTLGASLRAKAGMTAAGAEVTVTAEATPETRVTETDREVVLSNVRVTGTGAGMQESTLVTLRVRYSGASASVVVERSDVRVGGEAHRLRIVLPLVRS